MREGLTRESPIIAVDFDGTLCSHGFPGIGDEVQWAFRFLALWRPRCHLLLWTARTDHYLDDAVEWCRTRGLEFDAVNDHLPHVIEANRQGLLLESGELTGAMEAGPKPFYTWLIDDRNAGTPLDKNRVVHWGWVGVEISLDLQKRFGHPYGLEIEAIESAG